MSAAALSGKPSHHATLSSHTHEYQGCLRHHAHLLRCFLRNGLPCPSRKQSMRFTDPLQ